VTPLKLLDFLKLRELSFHFDELFGVFMGNRSEFSVNFVIFAPLFVQQIGALPFF